MASPATRYLAIVIGLATPMLGAEDQPQATTQRNAPLQSVLRRKTQVFAVNKFGVFRATLESRQWNKLNLPEGMPLGGRFAKVPPDSRDLLYVVSGPHGDFAAAARYGIYASHDEGENWNLLSENRDYGPVLLLPNGSLFAVTTPANRSGPSRVYTSKDMGKNWRDITGSSFGDVSDIIPDPDHPGQICLDVATIRNYILQADNEQYLWKATRASKWHVERFRTTDFFERIYQTQTVLYILLSASRDSNFCVISAGL